MSPFGKLFPLFLPFFSPIISAVHWVLSQMDCNRPDHPTTAQTHPPMGRFHVGRTYPSRLFLSALPCDRSGFCICLALWLTEWQIWGNWRGDGNFNSEKTFSRDYLFCLLWACPSSGHLFRISFLRPTAVHNCPFQLLQNPCPGIPWCKLFHAWFKMGAKQCCQVSDH